MDDPSQQRLEGHVALVVGGSGTLGGASGVALAREGAKVALSFRKGKEIAAARVNGIQAAGGAAFAAYLDVTDPASVKSFVDQTLNRYGAIHILINAHGRVNAADAVRLPDIDPQAWDDLFAVDVRGTLLMCKEVVPHMRRTGKGAIVNFSGSYGNGVNQINMVNSVAIPYCSRMGAIRGMTVAMARDLAPEIRVNAISPGPIEANWEAVWDVPVAHMEEVIAMTPLKRLGRPTEIAETVVFLASEGAGYMTGQILEVAGGWILSG